MATTVENPFNTQQANSSSGGIIGGTINNSTQSAGGVATPNTFNTQTYTAQQSKVDPKTETVSGQVDSILAKDSPLMQRARTIASQGMAQRGLVNSSMAQGAGTAAMIDRATPIAQQDAATYSNRAMANQEAANTANQFNVNQNNQLFQQASQQEFQGSQSQLDRAQQAYMQDDQQSFLTSQSALDRTQQKDVLKVQQDFQAAQANLDRAQQTALADKSAKAQLDLQTAQQNFQSAQSALDRAQQTNIQNDQQAFQETQSKLDRQQQIDLQSMQIKAQQAQIPSNYAATISNTTTTGINAILGDGALNADQKKAAINNVVNYANAQIDWAAKFYGTTIPKITTPTVA